jgi:hypothetical protein
MSGFTFRRIYFRMDDDISAKFTTEFLLESDGSQVTATTSGAGTQSPANTGALSYQGKLTTYVKAAYLEWKDVYHNADLYIGQQLTPEFYLSESTWGHRFLEKTIMDVHGLIPPVDQGLGLRGKFDDDGVFSYWALISNGDGAFASTSRFHSYAATLKLHPDNYWTMTLAYDYRAHADINDPTSTTLPKATLPHDTMTVAAFAAYVRPNEWSLGVEAFTQMGANSTPDLSAANGSLTTLTRHGITGWGTYSFQSDLELVARYDYYDPNTQFYYTSGSYTGESRNYMLASLDYKPDPHVHLAPGIQYETYNSIPAGGTFNGVVYDGKVHNGVQVSNGLSFDASFTARVTFWYIFM